MKIYLYYLAILAVLPLHNTRIIAQSLTPQVVASGGGSFTAGGYTLDFTIGEPTVTTLIAGSSILTQGFQQPNAQSGTSCAVKIWLEGPFNGTNMTTALQSGGIIPLAQPFNTLPWQYNGTETVGTMPINVTDWVLLELRSGVNIGGTLLEQRAALLYNDGSVRDVNGNAFVTFSSVAAGNYYIAVKPRGNLAVLSANAVTLPNNSTPYDFTTAINTAYGANQLKLVGGQACLIAGDADNNGIISVADYNRFQTDLVGGINVYRTPDFNKDRQITVLDFNLYAPNTSIIGVQAIRY